jgi:hypothetical protein
LRVFYIKHLNIFIIKTFKHFYNENAKRSIWEAGCMPFAQLYQQEERKDYPTDYKKIARTWQRPAATRAHMEKGTDFRDFGT